MSHQEQRFPALPSTLGPDGRFAIFLPYILEDMDTRPTMIVCRPTSGFERNVNRRLWQESPRKPNLSAVMLLENNLNVGEADFWVVARLVFEFPEQRQFNFWAMTGDH